LKPKYLPALIAILYFNQGFPFGIYDRTLNLYLSVAKVPLATMFGYATDLRSTTQGRATFTMQFDRYEEVPQSIAGELVDSPTPS